MLLWLLLSNTAPTWMPSSTLEFWGEISVPSDPAHMPKRLPYVDLLRFIAALAVTLYHYVSCYPVAEDTSRPVIAAMASVTRYGYLGVDLFFMISGFVILWSSLKRDTVSFVISRVSRLYPSFWVSLALAVLLINIFTAAGLKAPAAPPSWQTIVANITMVPGALHMPLVEGVYWTLEIEIRFYALIFLVLLFRKMPQIEFCLYAWLACALGAQLWELPWAFGYFTLDPYGPFFAAGCLFYLISSRGISVLRISALLICAIACMYVSIKQRSQFITPDVVSGFVVPALVIVFFTSFWWLIRAEASKALADWSYQLGALTYPLYLTHATMGYLVYHWLRPMIGVELSLLIITILAFAVAWLITHQVDIPTRRPLTNWLYRCARTVGYNKMGIMNPSD